MGQLPERCLARVRGVYTGLRPAEQRVADYLLAHPDRALALSVTELASAAGTSESTVVKFAQKLGYGGYRQLRLALALESGTGVPRPVPVYGEIETTDSLETIRSKLLAAYTSTLHETMELLDPPLWERAADALARARRIHFYGVGASGFVALDAQHKFARIGMDAWAYTDPHLASAFAALLEQGDVAVGISHSGGTLDTLHALRAAREAGATTMCITHRMDAPIVELASIALFTSGHEAPFRSGAIVSRMAQLAVVDALFIAVAIRRGADAMRRLLASREAVEEKHVGPGKAWRDT